MTDQILRIPGDVSFFLISLCSVNILFVLGVCIRRSVFTQLNFELFLRSSYVTCLSFEQKFRCVVSNFAWFVCFFFFSICICSVCLFVCLFVLSLFSCCCCHCFYRYFSFLQKRSANYTVPVPEITEAQPRSKSNCPAITKLPPLESNSFLAAASRTVVLSLLTSYLMFMW